jgi:protein SDA1
MGMASGAQPLPYGHSAEAAVDIAGLALLEDHLQQLRAEEGIEGVANDEDDEAGWDNWDVESDSSTDSSEDGWINVTDDDDDLDVSDSDDDDNIPLKNEGRRAEGTSDDADARVSTLATTKVS